MRRARVFAAPNAVEEIMADSDKASLLGTALCVRSIH
jgi:hypothetical protein